MSAEVQSVKTSMLGIEARLSAVEKRQCASSSVSTASSNFTAVPQPASLAPQAARGAPDGRGHDPLQGAGDAWAQYRSGRSFGNGGGGGGGGPPDGGGATSAGYAGFLPRKLFLRGWVSWSNGGPESPGIEPAEAQRIVGEIWAKLPQHAKVLINEPNCVGGFRYRQIVIQAGPHTSKDQLWAARNAVAEVIERNNIMADGKAIRVSIEKSEWARERDRLLGRMSDAFDKVCKTPGVTTTKDFKHMVLWMSAPSVRELGRIGKGNQWQWLAIDDLVNRAELDTEVARSA
jgi:hypothetical protein